MLAVVGSTRILRAQAACILLITFGCGGSGEAPDAREESLPTDAPGCDAARPVVVVGPAVAEGSSTQLALSVVSHDSEGTICRRAAGSGPGAHINIDAPASGMVTMVVDANELPARRIFTWTGVQPGDELYFPSILSRGITTKVVQVQLTVAALAGASSYDLQIMCEGGGSSTLSNVVPGTSVINVSCRSDAQAVTGRARATTASGRSFALGEIASISGSGPTTLQLASWSSATSTTTTITGASGYESVTVALMPIPSFAFEGTATLSSAAISDPVVVGPALLPSSWMIKSTISLSTAGQPRHTASLAHTYVSTPGSIDISAPEAFLGQIVSSLKQGLPRPEVTWQPAASLGDGTIVFARIGDWSMIREGGSLTIRFPELPPDLLSTSANLESVEVVKSASITGFNDIRTDPIQVFLLPEHQTTVVGTPFAGVFL